MVLVVTAAFIMKMARCSKRREHNTIVARIAQVGSTGPRRDCVGNVSETYQPPYQRRMQPVIKTLACPTAILLLRLPAS